MAATALLCRVGSELCFLIIMAGLIIIYDYTLHRFDLDLCVVGPFACFVPIPFSTRTVIPESFQVKIIEENFCSKTSG